MILCFAKFISNLLLNWYSWKVSTSLAKVHKSNLKGLLITVMAEYSMLLRWCHYLITCHAGVFTPCHSHTLLDHETQCWMVIYVHILHIAHTCNSPAWQTSCVAIEMWHQWEALIGSTVYWGFSLLFLVIW